MRKRNISHTPSLFPNALNPLKSSPPCPATPPTKLGVEVPVTLIEDVIREISRVRRTYSKAETSAPEDLSSFSSSAISSFVMALSGTERKKTRTRRSLSSAVNSPSGRDARKNSRMDDVVCYL